MSKTYEILTPKLQTWLKKQKVFFVATALPALVVLWAGCPSVSPGVSGVAKPASAPKFPAGVIEHAPSGMQFPQSVAGFTRVRELHAFDAAGRDVSVGYNLASTRTPVVLTIYVYPSPDLQGMDFPEPVLERARKRLADEVFQRSKYEITMSHGGVQPLREAEIPALPASLSRPGYIAQYTYKQDNGGGPQPVNSLLMVYCYVGGAWTVKFRVTYPLGVDGQPAVDRFLQELKWTIPQPK